MTSGKDALRLHDAFKAGDLAAIRGLLGDPAEFPNCRIPMSLGDGWVLSYAIYHGPLSLIRGLVDLGADVNYEDHSFPSLIATLVSEREDMQPILELLVNKGADVNQRGHNDYTPLHYAVGLDKPEAVRLLAAHGAYLKARTRIDDFESTLDGTDLETNEAARVLKAAIEESQRQRRPGASWVPPPTAERLLREIDSAFQEWTPPVDDSLFIQQDKVCQFFRGKRWQEVTMEEIVQSSHIDWDDFIFSLSWKGFVYYLPAFLKLSLDVDGPADIGDSLLFMLGIFHVKALPPALDERQKFTVVHVLEYLASEYGRRGYKMNLAQEALDRYWTRPEVTGLRLNEDVQE